MAHLLDDIYPFLSAEDRELVRVAPSRALFSYFQYEDGDNPQDIPLPSATALMGHPVNVQAQARARNAEEIEIIVRFEAV